ncbi:hypothetical protein [Pseudomonas monteilii]|uniref:hypothetical protein n=1 Tax=Pseudomonas monteilii TaxID=76759 RepID=UPI0036E4C9F5
MIYLKPKILSSLTLAFAFGSLGALSGCNDHPEKAKQPEASSPSVSTESPEPTFEELNTTLVAKFSRPDESQESTSLDILRPETAFALYNSLRSWEEDGRDIARLLQTSVGEGAVPLFKLGMNYSSATDEFKKRDLEEKILAETKREASKIHGNRSVIFVSEPGSLVSLSLGEYNFDEKSFKVDHCLFSDKLEYSKEESRYAQNLKGADQERCYFRTTNTELKVGFVGGSRVRFKVEDPDLARKIAEKRGQLKFKVYGYVESVQRDKVGGNLVKERRVLIAPQRVVLTDSNGQVLSEANI